jgi:DNA polymerase-1
MGARLLIVDGSNIVMRAAFGGDIAPDRSIPIASGIIERATREWEATHLVIALDGAKSGPSWRKELFAEYKANRERDTSAWLQAAFGAWVKQGWWVEECAGYEADDVIATVATRALASGIFAAVMILSGDSDVLPLIEKGTQIIKPLDGGKFRQVLEDDVLKRYGVSSALLPQLKALMGEPGDNVPGVDGIGPVRGTKLLRDHQSVEGVIAHGSGPLRNKYSAMVAAQADVARRALKLVTLAIDAPVIRIQPSGCAL